MDINQFAVYQLKNGPETRQMRFRSYEKLQQSGIQVRYEYYREVYLGKMQRQDTPENIRERLQKKIPKSFDGHSLSVSDVLVLNREKKKVLPSLQVLSALAHPGRCLPLKLRIFILKAKQEAGWCWTP